MEPTNAERARWGAIALDAYTRNVKEYPPVSAQGLAAHAHYATDQYAKAAGMVEPRKQAETDLEEAAAILRSAGIDVLHHMDAAVSAPALVEAAAHLYRLKTGETCSPLLLLTDDSTVPEAVEFLAALCFAAATFAADPDDTLTVALRHFQDEAETERLIRAREARAARLSNS